MMKNKQKKQITNRTKNQEKIKSCLNFISKVNSKWAADIGMQAFTTPLYRKKAKKFPEGTTSLMATIKGKKMAIYNYGKSANKILLVHGWEGAATDFSLFFIPLVEAGFEVIAVDLPGHGHSAFSQLNAMMTADIIAELNNRFGKFSGVIGHSFGAFSLGYALSKFDQFSEIPFISIGSPTRLKTILSEFSKVVGFKDLQLQYINTKIEKKYKIRVSDFEQGKFMKAHNGPVMVIHDKNDKMVPIDRINDIQSETSGPVFMITEGLGHNRILRNKEVIAKAVSFIKKFPHQPNIPDKEIKMINL